MTDTIDVVAADPVERAPAAPGIDEQSVAERLVAQARKKGIELVGPDRLLSQLTKRFLETALEAEMSDHLGYDKHDPVGRNSGNSRNGMRSKTVLTEIGPVEIEVPRDIDASFQPQIVRKRQRRSTGVDQIVLSLSARGLTNARRCSHQPEVQVADSQIGPQAAELQGPERARNPDKPTRTATRAVRRPGVTPRQGHSARIKRWPRRALGALTMRAMRGKCGRLCRGLLPPWWRRSSVLGEKVPAGCNQTHPLVSRLFEAQGGAG